MTTPTTGLDGLRERAENCAKWLDDHSLKQSGAGKAYPGDNIFADGAQVIRDLLTARAEGWRSIETAPKDYTEVLVTNGTSVGEARYHDDGNYYWANCHPTDATDGMVWMPTHWQPLPAPPSASPAPAQDAATGGAMPSREIMRERIAADPDLPAEAGGDDAALRMAQRQLHDATSQLNVRCHLCNSTEHVRETAYRCFFCKNWYCRHHAPEHFASAHAVVIEPREIAGANGEQHGKWRLTRTALATVGLCSHEHDSPDEARSCPATRTPSPGARELVESLKQHLAQMRGFVAVLSHENMRDVAVHLGTQIEAMNGLLAALPAVPEVRSHD